MTDKEIFPEIKIPKRHVPQHRKDLLKPLITYIRKKKDQNLAVNLNFICTHNSRRSQLAQVWAQLAATLNDVEVQCFSGGVEVTAFNESAVKSLERSGFQIEKEGEDNPVYSISYAEGRPAIHAFSKLYDDDTNPKQNFAAIMTCSHADENCPFIPGAEIRIPLNYDDPKEFDNTPHESFKYDERSAEIASEMFYVFSKIN